MSSYHAHADPPPSLAQRLAQLNGNLQALGEKLKNAIASLIGSAIAEAIRDVIRNLLGVEEASPAPSQGYRERWDDSDRAWQDEDPRWSGEENFFPPGRPNASPSTKEPPKRWRNAWTAGVQTALWWLAHQSCRRPVITTVAVGLAAGVTGFVAGPAVAAGVGVLASIASLLLTADATRSAAKLVSG